MAIVKLSLPQNFSSDQEWDWVVTSGTRSSIVIQGGGHKQSFSGNFTYVGDQAQGTVTSTSYYSGGKLVYKLSNASLDAATI